MELKEIAAVSGKQGLFQILKPTRNGVVLESLDEQKAKLVISSNTKISILKDISMYTTSGDGNMQLADILIKVKETFGTALPVSAKSDEKELRDFFVKVVPDYDAERVYGSDIKKLVSWYGILAKYSPEVLEPQKEEANAELEAASSESAKVADADKKKVEKKAAPKQAAAVKTKVAASTSSKAAVKKTSSKAK